MPLPLEPLRQGQPQTSPVASMRMLSSQRSCQNRCSTRQHKHVDQSENGAGGKGAEFAAGILADSCSSMAERCRHWPLPAPPPRSQYLSGRAWSPEITVCERPMWQMLLPGFAPHGDRIDRGGLIMSYTQRCAPLGKRSSRRARLVRDRRSVGIEVPPGAGTAAAVCTMLFRRDSVSTSGPPTTVLAAV